jgi:hypothetical protein
MQPTRNWAVPVQTGSQNKGIATWLFIPKRGLRSGTRWNASLPGILALCLIVGASFISKLYGQAGFGRTDRGRQTIKAKLASIQLDTFKAEGLPLSEVIKLLSNEAKRRDPEKRGINFLLNSNNEGAPTAVNQPASAPVPPAERVDIAELQIKIAPMTDVSLEQVLKAIVKVAGPPRLKYEIEDYAVIFYPSGEAMALETRVFKVDPNTFQQGMHSVVGVPFASVRVTAGTGGGGTSSGQAGQSAAQVTMPRVQVAPGSQGQQGGIHGVSRTNSMDTVQASVRSFLQSIGVDMTPPKSAVFNDRQGTLVVRATLADLELIEAALGHL